MSNARILADLMGTSTTVPSSKLSLVGSDLPSGTVLQVKFLSFEDLLLRTGTNYADIPSFSLSITPSSASNKILVTVQLAHAHTGSNTILYRLVRGSTTIAENPNIGSADSFINHYAGGNAGFYHANRPFLDSPATTSATTYKLQWRVDAATGYLNRHVGNTNYGGTSSMTLMEIAG
jgi:hypothetical protein